MGSGWLKAAMVCAVVQAQEKPVVVIQGRARGPVMVWTACERGNVGQPAEGGFFKVPSGRNLVITEVAFTLRSAPTRFARAAHVRLVLKKGQETFDLAEVSGRQLVNMESTTFWKSFSPGLLIPGGAEAGLGKKDIHPPGGAVDVTFYGYFTPSS